MNARTLILVFLAISMSPAFAAAKFEFTGKCLAAVEAEIDDLKEDDSGCVNGAYVESIDEVNGDVYSVGYGRNVCEGYINGSADVTIEVLKQKTVRGVTKISSCKVKNVLITEESGD